jgi:hypothetical protein
VRCFWSTAAGTAFSDGVTLTATIAAVSTAAGTASTLLQNFVDANMEVFFCFFFFFPFFFDWVTSAFDLEPVVFSAVFFLLRFLTPGDYG